MNKRILFCWLLVAACCVRGWPQSAQKRADTAPAVFLEVLFATNADADLFVNGEPQGLLSQAAFRYIKLAPGRYAYTLRSRRTADETTDSFSVAPGRLNEVFVDVLYLVDQKEAERQRLAAARPATGQPQLPPVPTGEASAAAVQAAEALLGGLVPMRAGSFRMGNEKSPLPDEREHTVLLGPFRMGKYEVTQQQFEALMGYNPSANTGCPACPVENLSWEEAQRFVQRLNIVSGQRFRLPTEAEWEYAARTGGRTEIEKAGGPEAYIQQTAWHFFDAGGKTKPVGGKRPNAAGLYDMLGNVAEWCADWYDPGYYRLTNQTEDPKGPEEGTEKVVRGGSFKGNTGDHFRPSFRNRLAPAQRSPDTGLRLAMDGW